MRKQIICKSCGEIRGHYAWGLCGKCYWEKHYIKNKEKIRTRNRKWQLENKENVKARQKKYRLENKENRNKWCLENKEKLKAWNKKYYLENKEKIKATTYKWQQNNPEKIRENSRKYRDEHKEILAEKSKKWRQTYDGKLSMKRRRIKRKTYGDVKLSTIKKLLNVNIFKYGIITCEKDKKPCPDNFHIDHIIPVSRGGSNGYANLQILCARCNLSKHTKIADYRNKIENNQLYLGEVI